MALLLTFLHEDDFAARPWMVAWSLLRVGPSFGCDRASANVFGGNRTIFCLKGPSVPIATGPEA
jgi:hypothetical protein